MQQEQLPWAAQTLPMRLSGHDAYTARHSRAVMRYALALRQALGAQGSGVDQTQLMLAALLHDVGKCAVPAEILRKKAALTQEEYRLIQRHPLESERMLAPCFGADIARIAGSHHERLDGSGYPHGLRGGQISLAARIVAVADAFDAMTSDRGYNSVKTPEQAAQELMQKGDQYDPVVTAALARIL